MNLERALRISDRLGGHLVTGHIDSTGVIVKRSKMGKSVRFSLSLDPQWSVYVVEKGSIALDGVSLTVNRVEKQFFEVNIIPHTLAHTTLNEWKEGDRINIETDLIGKYIQKMLTAYVSQGADKSKEGITLEKLSKLGFLK